MRAEYEAFPTPQPDKLRQDADKTTQEIARLGDLLEQTRADLRRSRTEVMDYQSKQESHVRRTRILWAIALMLVVSLAGLVWIGSPLMKEHRGLFNQMPSLQTAFDSVGNRVSSAEGKLNTWANDRIGMNDRMAKIEKTMSSGLKVARSEAQAMAKSIRSDITQSIQAIQSRLSGVESTQREAHEEVARLQDELAGVRRELATVREETAQQRNQVQQMQQTQQATQNELSGVDRRVIRHQSNLDALSHAVERQRVNFELSKGRTQEVTPGIYLTIKQTDVARQRADGWLQISSDGRILWLRDEGVQNQFAFSSQRDERTYQLVLTRIAKNSASGYLLVPIMQEGSGAPASDN